MVINVFARLACVAKAWFSLPYLVYSFVAILPDVTPFVYIFSDSYATLSFGVLFFRVSKLVMEITPVINYCL